MSGQTQMYATPAFQQKTVRSADWNPPPQKKEPPIIIFEGKPFSSKYITLHLKAGWSMCDSQGGTGSNAGDNNNVSFGKKNPDPTASTHKRFIGSPKKFSHLSSAALLGIALVALFYLAVYAKRDVFPRLEGRVQSINAQ